jgi:hypothetical protein
MSTPGDSGYWIEGPTGEDIRSIWRGQPVHVLVVDALLHPRATNLPPHVQTAYIQSAMKVCLLFSLSVRHFPLSLRSQTATH